MRSVGGREFDLGVRVDYLGASGSTARDSTCPASSELFEGVRWAAPTGLHIWVVPAFADGLVFAPSFDRNLCAFEQDTGGVRWSRNLGNFVASSPAVAEGLVVVGSFGHHVTAVDAASGRRAATGGSRPSTATAASSGATTPARPEPSAT